MSDEQKLFLIEFLVDKVNVPSVRAMQDDFMPAKTCVSFKVFFVNIKKCNN